MKTIYENCEECEKCVKMNKNVKNISWYLNSEQNFFYSLRVNYVIINQPRLRVFLLITMMDIVRCKDTCIKNVNSWPVCINGHSHHIFLSFMLPVAFETSCNQNNMFVSPRTWSSCPSVPHG